MVVDGVQPSEHVHELERAAARIFGGERGHVIGVAQDSAVHLLHHVERSADDVRVVAERVHLRYRHVGRRESVQDSVLATHVVSGRDDVPEGRTPHDPGALAVADGVGQVRSAARDQLRMKGTIAGIVDVLGEPRPQLIEIDAFGRGHRAETMPARSECGYVLVTRPRDVTRAA